MSEADKQLSNLIRRWTRAGAMFNATPSSQQPDFEAMLIDTAILCPKMARLFIMAATWLSKYERLIAHHRLRRMAQDLKGEALAALGLLIETATQHTDTTPLRTTIEICKPLDEPRPLFEIQRKPSLLNMAESKATPLSKRWNLWCEHIELKGDALRTRKWIMEKNRNTWQLRADYKGGLRASIMMELMYSPESGRSIKYLSERCGAAYSPTCEALQDLQLAGRIDWETPKRGRRPDKAGCAIGLAA